MDNLKAEIIEIFSSIQGEGIFIGARQIFVRFKECNLSCLFCDEDLNAGSEAYSHADLLGQIKFLELSKGPHHSVSLTGGEPLLYAGFLKRLLPMLRNEGLKSYLETNGTLPGELGEVIDFVDVIAMDIKLPSSTGDKAFWDEHILFIKKAVGKKVFIKVVVTSGTTLKDMERAVCIVKDINPDIPFIIQPASLTGKGGEKIKADALMKFMELAAKNNLKNVRVIPQIHKIINVK